MTETRSPDAILLADEIALADVGELSGPLTHEVNNLLNNLTLHLAVMQQVGPTTLGPDLEAIRRQITQFAGVVSRFQRRRQRDRGEAPTVDLNAAITEAAAMLKPATINLDLEHQLPGVRGHAADLRRLCRFLLANGVRAVGHSGPPVLARTRRSAASVQLLVEDAGPDVPESALPRIFEPANECREGICGLELAACRTLIRRLGGAVEASPRPGGGLVIAVTLPAAQSRD
jgi:signal transduction histidine kinase